MKDIKRLPLEEFVDFGYLSELNRRFLHPLGLALEYYRDSDGKVRLGGVWDYRDDPEGMAFYEPDQEKYERVETEWQSKAALRDELLGYVVQPHDHKIPRPDGSQVPLLREK